MLQCYLQTYLQVGRYVHHLYFNFSLTASFLFWSFQQLVLVNKICWWQDLNHISPVSEATALPTEPPPLPDFIILQLTCRSRQLRTASNRLLMSLAVADVTILLNCYQVVIQVISGGPVLGTLGILSLLLIYFHNPTR